jgi:hypothetical protein
MLQIYNIESATLNLTSFAMVKSHIYTVLLVCLFNKLVDQGVSNS